MILSGCMLKTQKVILFMKIRKSFYLSSMIFILSQQSFSEISKYTFDKDHTKIGFEAIHLGFSTVSGHFKDIEGEFSFDDKDLSKTALTAKGRAASVFTDNEKRDKHLISADFFDAAKFPEISFTSKKVENIQDKNFKLAGDLTMKGVTKPVIFDVTYLGMINAFGKTRTAFKAKASVNRKDFGLNFSTLADAVPVVSDMIDIVIHSEGIKKEEVAKK